MINYYYKINNTILNIQIHNNTYSHRNKQTQTKHQYNTLNGYIFNGKNIIYFTNMIKDSTDYHSIT